MDHIPHTHASYMLYSTETPIDFLKEENNRAVLVVARNNKVCKTKFLINCVLCIQDA